MDQIHTHYDNLKVARNAPPEVIRAAYKALSQKFHPDRNPGNAEAARIMVILNASYEVLSDPDKRREHDQWIALQELMAVQATHLNSQPKPTPRPEPTPASTPVRKTIYGFAQAVGKTINWLAQAFGVLMIPGAFIWIWATDKPSTPPPGPSPYQATPSDPAGVPWTVITPPPGPKPYQATPAQQLKKKPSQQVNDDKTALTPNLSAARKQARATAPSHAIPSQPTFTTPNVIAPLSWDEIVRWEEYLQFTPEQKAQVQERFREVFGGQGLGNLPPLPWDELIETSAYKALTAEDKVLVKQWASLFLQYRNEAYRHREFGELPQELARGPRLIPSIPLPESGETRRFTQQEAVAPFEIKSSIGSYYLVKLVDAYSGAEVLTVFLHGGETVQIKVPLGTYIVKYGAGTRWYGYGHKEVFGQQGAYTKADKLFIFERNDYQVTGYTITLYAAVGGNLHTYAIRPEDF